MSKVLRILDLVRAPISARVSVGLRGLLGMSAVWAVEFSQSRLDEQGWAVGKGGECFGGSVLTVRCSGSLGFVAGLY